MNFSTFGKKFTQNSPIMQLMNDLGDALKSDKPINMLGGGNPAHIDAVDDAFLQSFRELDLHDHNKTPKENPAVESMGNYANPQGDAEFIHELCNFLNRHYAKQWGMALTEKNIALTNGSQNAFFYLFNIFSGKFDDCSTKKILLPLSPEYIGYNDAHVDTPDGKPHFVSIRPKIIENSYTDSLGNQLDGFFKYSVDFDALKNHPELLAGNIGAICCSRPTNPTGNVLTDEEMAKLDAIAKQYDIPLIVDNAYGMPFPNMITTQATLSWNSNTILCFSLSKIGLPGLRTGIIVADEAVIHAISCLNAIVNLSPTRFGASITKPLLKNDQIKTLSEQHIQPFYQQKAEYAISLLKQEFADYPVKIHNPEGAMFLWIWFEGLPITTLEVYKRLKDEGTIIIPSQHFYVGQDISDYQHAHECIRMSVAQPDEILQKGIAHIGQLIRHLYDENTKI